MVQASGAPDRIDGTYQSVSPESTINLGFRLGSEIRPGDLILLRGGLGAGKTFEIRGCGFFNFRNGKIIYQRGYWDKLSWFKQVGLPID